MTEYCKDVVQSVDEDQSHNRLTYLRSKSSSKTEFEQSSKHIPSIEVQPIPTEEDYLLQAAFNILYTVPRAIEHFIDREYKGGFIKAIRDHKDKLNAKLRTVEWDLLTKLTVHHRVYHFYDQIIQDTILDNEVLDLLISKCILRKEDREEIEHYPRQSDRNKCILDLLIQRPQDSFGVLLNVLKESSTCSKEMLNCMENQQLSHLKDFPQPTVKLCITGFHSVRLQKNYHNLTQNLSNTESIIDSLISKEVLHSDDRAEINSSGVQAKINRKLIDHIRSKEDYQIFLEALNEDPMNIKLVSDLESCDVEQDDLKLLQSGARVPQLTNKPGFQTLVTLVSMIQAVQVSDTEPTINDTSLPADLYRLQSWYKNIIKMSSMDSQQYQHFVQTVNEVLERISGENDHVVKETTLSTVMQNHIQKTLDCLKEKDENSELQEKLKKIESELVEILPKNIREQIKKHIADWEEKDKMFVSTRASDSVMERLQNNSCLTLTGPSGVGKTFIARHVSLFLKKKGYDIIPVYSPTDIRTYYQPGKLTVFIIDDICGNFTANQQQIDNWKQMLPVINKIVADKCCKIIVSCRLQVYKDDKFNLLIPFKSCECNLISDKLCLTPVEKTNIAQTYIGSSVGDIDKLSHNSEFFPLLCSLYDSDRNEDVKEFFKNPFKVYQNELDNLCLHGDEGILRICSLALCVIFNNQLGEIWLKGKLTDQQKHIIEDICDACEINRITSKAKLKKALDTLDGTFICKQNAIYKTMHDKLFDFLAYYFGQKMIKCLIDHGDSDLVHERFIWQESPDDKNSTVDFIIKIPDEYLESYLERFIKDWSVGNVSDVFNNNNMKVSSFREQLLQYLLQLDKPQQVILASTKDTVKPKEECGSGSTPLVLTCYYGYTDMVQWMLTNDVDLDQCRDDGATGLNMASQEGHTDIVTLLLQRNPNVDLCDNVGFTPLIRACIDNHTSIVQKLIKHKPDVNAQTIDGGNALIFSALNGNIEIMQLLLENNADCNICCYSKQNVIDTINNHPRENLDKVKQEIYDDLVEQASPHVADYISTKSVDYVFDVDAGCSTLHHACFMGRTDVVRCLLDYNANINMTKEDGTTPIFYACEVGHEEIVCLLLEKGADTQICKLDGKSPLTIATDNGHTSIVILLTEHMNENDTLSSQI